jgi:hypothetical protein
MACRSTIAAPPRFDLTTSVAVRVATGQYRSASGFVDGDFRSLLEQDRREERGLSPEAWPIGDRDA